MLINYPFFAALFSTQASIRKERGDAENEGRETACSLLTKGTISHAVKMEGYVAGIKAVDSWQRWRERNWVGKRQR